MTVAGRAGRARGLAALCLLLGFSVCVNAAGVGNEREVVAQADWSVRLGPAHVKCLSQHRRAGVVTAMLSNGVDVHIRSMPKAGQGDDTGPTVVTLTLSGGELLESGDNRGITALTASSLNAELTSAIDDMDSREQGAARAGVTAAADAIQIRLEGDVQSLLRATSVVRGMLERPSIGAEHFDRVHRTLMSDADRDGADGRSIVSEALAQMVFPAKEARVRPVTRACIERLTLGAVQAWWQHHATAAQMQIGIAGEVTVEQGIALSISLLGEVPVRAQVAEDASAPSRSIPHPVGPIEQQIDAALPLGTSTIISGFLGAEGSRTQEFRILRAATRVLDTRVRERLAEAIVADCASRSGCSMVFSPYRGFGMVVISASLPRSAAGAGYAILRDEFDRMKLDGPSAEELGEATMKLAEQAQRAEQDPAFWSVILSRAKFSGIPIDDLAGAEAFYQSLTPEDVRRVISEKWLPERRIGLIVRGAADVPAR